MVFLAGFGPQWALIDMRQLTYPGVTYARLGMRQLTYEDGSVLHWTLTTDEDGSASIANSSS